MKRIILNADLLRAALQVAIEQLTGGRVNEEIRAVGIFGADNTEVPLQSIAIHYGEVFIDLAEYTEVHALPAPPVYRGKPTFQVHQGGRL